jgi:hypothetical protein
MQAFEIFSPNIFFLQMENKNGTHTLGFIPIEITHWGKDQERVLSQLMLPMIPHGTTIISELVSVVRDDDRWVYFAGLYPVYFRTGYELCHRRLAACMFTRWCQKKIRATRRDPTLWKRIWKNLTTDSFDHLNGGGLMAEDWYRVSISFTQNILENISWFALDIWNNRYNLDGLYIQVTDRWLGPTLTAPIFGRLWLHSPWWSIWARTVGAGDTYRQPSPSS